MEECGHHAECAGKSGNAVGESEGRQRRWTVLRPGLVGKATHRLGQGAECAALGVGSGLAEPGDAEQDQSRIDGMESVRTQPPLFEYAGAEVLHQHVGIDHEVAEYLLAFVGAEIESDALLVTGDDLPPQPVAVLPGSV